MAEKVSIYYQYGNSIEMKLVDEDMVSYIDIIYVAYCTVLRDVPDGHTLSFSITTKLPNGEPFIVKSDDDAMEVVRIFKREGKTILLVIDDVQVSETAEENFEVNGYSGKMIGKPLARRPSISTAVKRPTKTTIVRRPSNTTFGISHCSASTSSAKGKEKVATIVTDCDDDEGEDLLDENWDMETEASKESSTDSEYDSEDGEEAPLLDIGKEEFEQETTARDTKADIDDLHRVDIHVGAVYESVHTYRKILADFVVQEGVNILRVKNDKKRVTVVCVGDGCPWTIHAATRKGNAMSFVVKKFISEHTCGRPDKNKNATSTWIARKLAKQLKADPNLSFASMKAAVQARYNINPDDQQLYRARRVAREENLSSHKKSYASLAKYGEKLLERNPGSLFKLQFEDGSGTTAKPVFKRLFVCFAACKVGFLKGCRPFIGIDGCHLKGNFKGIILAATSMDANNGIFPIAFSVVEIENKDSWSWFLTALSEAISNDVDGNSLTFISDKQKGLSEAIAEIFPHAKQRVCCRHLYQNFRVKFSSLLLRRLFWAACKSYNAEGFNTAMEEIKGIKREAFDWLMRNPLSSWARYVFDHRIKSDHVTNNMSKCFNQWIQPFRAKPILNLIDEIRIQITRRLESRHQKGCSLKDNITPTFRKKLENAQYASRQCNVLSCGPNEYEIKDGFTRYVVDLKKNICECCIWEVTGIPCKHACAAIFFKRGKPEDHVSSYFTMTNFIFSYSELMHGMSGLDTIRITKDGPVIQHPIYKRQVGRLAKVRRREANEDISNFRKTNTLVTCAYCKAVGHNSRTCKKKKEAQSSQVVPFEESTSQLGTSQQSTSQPRRKRKEPTVPQRQTRFQASRGSQEASIQAKTKARMAKKAEKIRAKAAAAQG